MTSLTINLQEKLKTHVQKKAKDEGLTLTFVIIKALEAYNEGKISFGLLRDDDKITASFDVSTPQGKEAALKSFASIGHEKDSPKNKAI